MDFQPSLGNQAFGHFHMSTISTPYGGPARPGYGRPAQTVEARGDPRRCRGCGAFRSKIAPCRIRSPFAGLVDLGAQRRIRVLSCNEIERMLAEHGLYLETEYHEGHRANFASADLSRQDFSGLTFVLPAHRGRRLWTVFGANMFLLEVGTDAEH